MKSKSDVRFTLLTNPGAAVWYVKQLQMNLVWRCWTTSVTFKLLAGSDSQPLQTFTCKGRFACLFAGVTQTRMCGDKPGERQEHFYSATLWWLIFIVVPAAVARPLKRTPGEPVLPAQ